MKASVFFFPLAEQSSGQTEQHEPVLLILAQMCSEWCIPLPLKSGELWGRICVCGGSAHVARPSTDVNLHKLLALLGLE